MTRYTSSLPFSHRSAPTTAILLVQLGTPDRPDAAAVRRYLREFLSDPRVVEIPRLAWWPILHGLVLPTRPRQSARKYETVWTPDGSPLAIHTRRQASMLRGALGDLGLDVEVVHAMRYGQPAIGPTLRALRDKNLARLLVLPLYPQYSGPTTASVFDAVTRELGQWRNLPELRLARGFHRDPGYISALVASIRGLWQASGRSDKLVLSFHGLPRRNLDLGDPYHCECLATARLVANELGVPADDVVVTFQSRFGKARWLEPYTEPTLQAMAKKGVRSVDVACPGFVADCLETLEEIDQEVRHAFLKAGGKTFRYIPCLNTSADWIRALADLAQRQLEGWPVKRLAPELTERREALRAERETMAKARGARA